MASRSSLRLFQAARPSAPFRAYQPQPLRIARCFTTPPQREPLEPPPPPPYLATLKGDLKTAMRNKDAPRLAVLRAIISHNNNLAKTKQALKSDVDLVRYIMRMRKIAEDTKAEAAKAGRQDLVEKAEQEAQLLDEYEKASGVEVISEERMHELVAQEIVKSKDHGDMTKSLMTDVLSNVKKLVQGKMCDNRLLVPIVQQQIHDVDKAEVAQRMSKLHASKAKKAAAAAAETKD